MLDRLPTVLTADEILDKAFRKASRIEIPDPVKYHRVRKELMARVRSTTDVVGETLRGYVRAVPNLEHLRDYENAVLDILVGLDRLRRALGRIGWAADKVEEMGREHEAKGLRLRSIPGFHDLLKRHYGRVASVLKDIDDALAVLAEARDRVRMLPSVSPDHATVVIAGYPNVGKTSLLRAWTRSRAEVAPYAFTTKQAEVGHFEVVDRHDVATKVQVVDTPGLLDRPDEERNPVERQAVAALRHAADAVLFLVDPTGRCGYPVEEQERLRDQVAREMEGLPFLVAETKADLLRSGSGSLAFSTESGEGLEELKASILAMLPLHEPDLEADPLERWRRDPA